MCTQRNVNMEFHVIIFIPSNAIDELMKQKHNVPSINEPIMLLSSFRQTHLFIYYRETKTYAHLKEK